jgi:hypothetical protein
MRARGGAQKPRVRVFCKRQRDRVACPAAAGTRLPDVARGRRSTVGAYQTMRWSNS